MDENKKAEITSVHEYTEKPVIFEMYLEDEVYFRRLTNVTKFVEYSDGHSEVYCKDGKVTVVNRPIVMYNAYNRGVADE